MPIEIILARMGEGVGGEGRSGAHIAGNFGQDVLLGSTSRYFWSQHIAADIV